MVSRHRTFGEAHHQNIDKPIVADGQRVSDSVDGKHEQEHQEVFRVDKNQRDDHEFHDEQDVWNPQHHRRPRQPADERIKVRLSLHQPPDKPLVSEVTMVAAPKIRAIPITTEKHHDQGIREVIAR